MLIKLESIRTLFNSRLALLLSFQDSTRDILILHLRGHKITEIRKMLLDIYRPLLCAFITTKRRFLLRTVIVEFC